jgi:hypothetical protein
MKNQEVVQEKLDEVLEYFMEVTGAEVGPVIWEVGSSSYSKFTADITCTFAPTELHRLLFERIDLVVHRHQGERCTVWQFEFAYTHPGGGSNGKQIGRVFVEDDGAKHYRADGK